MAAVAVASPAEAWAVSPRSSANSAVARERRRTRKERRLKWRGKSAGRPGVREGAVASGAALEGQGSDGGGRHGGGDGCGERRSNDFRV